MRFNNKIAIVTAGSSGIGLGCAQRLASEGARVLNADIRKPSPDAERKFGNLPGEWRWIEADIGDREVPAKVIGKALELWRGIDVLINNAAYIGDQSGAVLETNLDQWDRQFAITLTGTFLMTQQCLPEMIKRGGGAIVNISSIGGINPFGEGTAYCTAKAAILQFTRSIAIDYGLKGIRCNAVCPGAIDTPTFNVIKSVPYELADREARTALGRIGLPEEIGAAVAFLASDDASYVTGATLVVDGGWIASHWNPRLGPRNLSPTAEV
jgi:meso-butanediol dehydrogenase/(S,S)-butanediol dehydrogenase/diacetyl reductase